MSRDVRIQRKVPDRRGGGVRGAVRGLSDAAGRRLLRAVRNVPELQAPGLDWVGLTYPAEWPRDGAVVKDHLRALTMRALRRGWCFVWALEYQTRGAPHFHLILKRPEFDVKTRAYRAWRADLARMWYEIVASGDERHLKAGTSSDPVLFPGAAARYLAGYLDKEAQKDPPPEVTRPGRMWGLVGCRVCVVEVLDGPEAVQAARVARRSARAASGSAYRPERPATARERADLARHVGVHKSRIQGATVGARWASPDERRPAYRPRDYGRGQGAWISGGGPAAAQYSARADLQGQAFARIARGEPVEPVGARLPSGVDPDPEAPDWAASRASFARVF